MAETIRLADYFTTETSNRPGEAARALAVLKEAGVNLLAFSGFPSGRRAQLDFIPADTQAFVKAGYYPPLLPGLVPERQRGFPQRRLPAFRE